MILKPCVDCGEPSDGPRCPDHRRAVLPAKSPRALGYDAAWDRLSRRARKLQPFCLWCGTTEDLTTDHTPEAWQRKEAGLPIRLQDVRVLCRADNARAGSARGPAPTWGEGVSHGRRGTHSKAEFQSEIDSQQGGGA